jgi:flagellar capping protein FliD
MRRFLLIFLVVMMPLQLSWAAVSSYCQHESGTASKHFGHHEHQHQQANQAELHQAQEELRKLRPLKDALAFEQRKTEELGQKLVHQEAENQTLQLNGAEIQTRFNTLLEKSQGLELNLAATKAAVTAQESMVASMLQRLTATAPTPEQT